ncbi:MAG: FtsX-like permease family protein [Actinomycetia bacterium]|nr:FtsX-like permease family protein [Actinomycetes bacterium]
MRSLGELVVVAMRGLWARPARTLLILLGPILGVAAIVAAVGLTESAKGDVQATLDELGTNLVTVQPTSRFQTGSLPRMPEETRSRLEKVDVIEGVTVLTELPGLVVLPHEAAALAFEVLPISVRAADSDLLEVADIPLAWGRWLDPWDERPGHRTVVLGYDTAEQLAVLPGETRSILIGDRSYGVAGVLDEAVLLPDLDLSVFVSFQAAADDWADEGGPSQAIFRFQEGLRLRDDDVNFLNSVITWGGSGGIDPPSVPTDALEASARVDETLRTVVALMGALALLVGGLGIANVMSISVLQRSPEIGIRRAVGHTRARLATQFLLEAIVVGVLGGIIGAAAGAGIVIVGADWKDWTIVLAPELLAGAAALAVVVAVVAGLVPAIKAARLEPLETLRLG